MTFLLRIQALLKQWLHRKPRNLAPNKVTETRVQPEHIHFQIGQEVLPMPSYEVPAWIRAPQYGIRAHRMGRE